MFKAIKEFFTGKPALPEAPYKIETQSAPQPELAVATAIPVAASDLPVVTKITEPAPVKKPAAKKSVAAIKAPHKPKAPRKPKQTK